MIEEVFKMIIGNEKVIERIIVDENINYNHMILPKGEGLPEHFSNSNVYMTVIRGTLTVALNEQEPQIYTAGTILKIPSGIKMNARNFHSDVLELTVVKAPAPRI